MNNSLSSSVASEISLTLTGIPPFKAFESKITYIPANLL
jgi:hypothetical protein